MDDKEGNDRRMQNDIANKEDLADTLRERGDESSDREAERQDNERAGLDAERRSNQGEDLGQDRS